MRLEDYQKWLESQFLDVAPERPANPPETTKHPVAGEAHHVPASDAPGGNSVASGINQERSHTAVVSEQTAPGFRSTVMPASAPLLPRAARHPAPSGSTPLPSAEAQPTESPGTQDGGESRLSLPLDFTGQEIAPPAGRFLRTREQEGATPPEEASVADQQPAVVVTSEAADTPVALQAGAAAVEASDASDASARVERQAEEARHDERVVEEAPAAAAGQTPSETTDKQPADPIAAPAPIVPIPVAPPTQQASQGPAASSRRRRGRSLRCTQPAEPVVPMDPERLWSLVPRHIQTLLAMDPADEEVAQNSYKRPFRESRLELIQRLLDPTLSLEDTARLLNVCPTTVRRYTNRGLLRHQRTPGDQRRFKLSDVLAFLEAQSKQNGN